LAKGGSLSAAQFLELFLFPPEKQFTYLNSLSGGEKKRLQLLTILFRNPNFLILDEPTNDLDLPTLAVLENFLQDYQGCILIVSHDRYFMDRLVDHLFVFNGDGDIKDFPGNYSQYRLWQKEEEKKEQETRYKAQEASSAITTENQQPETGNRKRAGFKEKREFELLQKEIAGLENEKKALEKKLSNPDLPFEQLNEAGKRIAALTILLNEKEMRWLELSELIE
jgi:ATP-binding cassette subfamily F protein uup